MGLSVTTAPASEPVSSAEVKEWLRIDSGDTSQDSTISLLITAARSAVEEYTRRTMIDTTYTWVIEAEQGRSPIYLPRIPVDSITSFTTHDEKVGASDTLVSTDNYELVESLKIVTRASGWSMDNEEAAATIVFKAGYGTASTDVPYDLRLAVLRIVARMFEGRGDEDPKLAEPIDQTTQMILAPYRYQL